MKQTVYRVNEAGEAVERNGKRYRAPDAFDYWPSVNTRTARYHRLRAWQRRMRERAARAEMRE